MMERETRKEACTECGTCPFWKMSTIVVFPQQPIASSSFSPLDSPDALNATVICELLFQDMLNSRVSQNPATIRDYFPESSCKSLGTLTFFFFQSGGGGEEIRKFC